MAIKRCKLLREINRQTGRTEINAIVSLLTRWLKAKTKRAFILRMYQEGENGIFIEDDNGGDMELLHSLAETMMFDENDHLHDVFQEEMRLGPIERR